MNTMNGMGISPAMFERLAGSLLHFVWQGAAIAMIAALALRLAKNRPPEWRYGVASFGLLAMLAAPFVTFAFYAETGAIAARVLRAVNGPTPMTAKAVMAGGLAVLTGWIVSIWILGVAVFLLRLIGGWLLSRRLVRRATAVAVPGVLEIYERARLGLKFHGRVRLLSASGIESPVVIGWLKPVILLPASALTGLDPDQLLAVLAHELAHIRRHDFLVNMLQRMVECVLFYHPAVWWLSGRIRVERELCCDDLAVAVCGDRLVYARALVALEKARSAEPALVVPTAGDHVRDRVRRLLGAGANRDWQSAIAALVFAAILVGSAVLQPATLAGPTGPVVSAVPIAALAAPPEIPATEFLAPIAALLTAEGVRAPETPAEPEPQVSQPSISAIREAARDKLGQLRVDYSVDSFVKQAAEGDTIAIKTFLAAGMNIDALNSDGISALAKAAQLKQTETVQSLLASGAKPDLAVLLKGDPEKDTFTETATAFSLAAGAGDLATMKVLLAGGANLELAVLSPKISFLPITALARAAAEGQRDAVNFLLDYKASIEGGAEARNTPLWYAACFERLAVVQVLLDRGANVNATGKTAVHAKEEMTALECATQTSNIKVMTLLLDRGAGIHRGMPLLFPFNSTKKTTEERATAAKLLIDRGADINVEVKDAPGQRVHTPLVYATEAQSVDLVRELLAKGADPSKGASLAWTLNRLYSSAHNPEIAVLLIRGGADLNFKTDGGQTPLSAAISAGQLEIVRALLEKGADPNLADNSRKPLSIVNGLISNMPVEKRTPKWEEIRQILIEAGATR